MPVEAAVIGALQPRVRMKLVPWNVGPIGTPAKSKTVGAKSAELISEALATPQLENHSDDAHARSSKP